MIFRRPVRQRIPPPDHQLINDIIFAAEYSFFSFTGSLNSRQTLGLFFKRRFFFALFLSFSGLQRAFFALGFRSFWFALLFRWTLTFGKLRLSIWIFRLFCFLLLLFLLSQFGLISGVFLCILDLSFWKIWVTLLGRLRIMSVLPGVGMRLIIWILNDMVVIYCILLSLLRHCNKLIWIKSMIWLSVSHFTLDMWALKIEVIWAEWLVIHILLRALRSV